MPASDRIDQAWIRSEKPGSNQKDLPVSLIQLHEQSEQGIL